MKTVNKTIEIYTLSLDLEITFLSYFKSWVVWVCFDFDLVLPWIFV